MSTPHRAVLLLLVCAGVARADDIPGDTARQGQAFRRQSFVPLPVLFYLPETRVGGGVAVMHAYRGSAEGRPIATAGSLLYTQNKQVLAGIGTDAWLADSRYHASGSVGYMKFPNSFYGIGNATPDSAESYTPRTFSVEGEFDQRVARGLYVGVTGDVGNMRIVETEAGGALASGTIRGSVGGRTAGLGVAVSYDTRDNVLAAGDGSLVRMVARRYAGVLGSDFAFTSMRVDVRRYRSFGGHVVAVQGLWQGTSGDVPFDRMPRLGGQNLLRGYFDGRYLDRHYVAAQVEYRTPTWRRLGLATFAGAGEVAPSLGDLTMSGIHVAGGGGLRIMLSKQERLALRLDVGAGKRSSGSYITVSEAF